MKALKSFVGVSLLPRDFAAQSAGLQSAHLVFWIERGPGFFLFFPSGAYKWTTFDL